MTLHSGLSDEELVVLAKQGNQEAFTLLYRRYFDAVYKRVSYAVPEIDVQDVTQEIFIALLRSLKGFEGRALFRTWFRTLTTRQIAEYYRNKHRKGADVPLQSDESMDIPDNSYQDVEGQILVRKALSELPAQYREIILMRFAEDLPFNEIAKLNHSHPEAAKSLFRRAISALNQKLEQQDARETI